MCYFAFRVLVCTACWLLFRVFIHHSLCLQRPKMVYSDYVKAENLCLLSFQEELCQNRSLFSRRGILSCQCRCSKDLFSLQGDWQYFSQAGNGSGIRLQLVYVTPLRSRWRKTKKPLGRSWSGFWKQSELKYQVYCIGGRILTGQQRKRATARWFMMWTRRRSWTLCRKKRDMTFDEIIYTDETMMQIETHWQTCTVVTKKGCYTETETPTEGSWLGRHQPALKYLDCAFLKEKWILP